MDSLRNRRDSSRSWVIAIAGGWIQLWSMAVMRASGVIFVFMVSAMDLTREEASWPFSLATCINNLVGPVTGLLIKSYDTRVISFVGMFMVGVAIALCYLTLTLNSATILIGVIAGMGIGLCNPTTIIVISQHFRNNRATGLGICFAGETIGAITFPFLFELLERRFSLRGAFLITGALLLNGLAGSILLKSKPTVKNAVCSTQSKTDQVLDEGNHHTKNVSQESTWRKFGANFRFLRIPMFYVIAFTSICFMYTISLYIITIVDFAKGKDISTAKAASLLSFFSAGDLGGRLLFGWLTDRKFVTPKNLIIFNFLVKCAALIGFTFVCDFAGLAVLSVVLGWSLGSTIVLVPILLTDIIGLEDLPMTNGFSQYLNGMSSLLRPALIGYFRDFVGSYNGLYYFLSVWCAFISIIWLIIGLIPRKLSSSGQLRRKEEHETVT